VSWIPAANHEPRRGGPQTNGICERFHKTALNEFYRVAFRKKVYRAPRTMPVSTRDWLSVQMMAVFERDFPPGWLPFVHLTPLS
jgi:transposase InsO family protein